MARESKAKTGKRKSDKQTVEIEREPNLSREQTLAKVMLMPVLKNAFTASAYSTRMVGETSKPLPLADLCSFMGDEIRKVADGDLGLASRTLAAQVMVLDTMFAELAQRAALNMGEYPEATERYLRLAFRAQTNCRTTVEALAKLHQPREQIVRHVHVNEGAQAIVADTFHNHAEGVGNAENDKQSHATGTAGHGGKVLGKDTQGNGVPIASGEGAKAMQDARRD